MRDGIQRGCVDRIDTSTCFGLVLCIHQDWPPPSFSAASSPRHLPSPHVLVLRLSLLRSSGNTLLPKDCALQACLEVNRFGLMMASNPLSPPAVVSIICVRGVVPEPAASGAKVWVEQPPRNKTSSQSLVVLRNAINTGSR